MPRIGLSDVLGLSVDGKLAPDAKLPSILPRFLKLQDTTLDQVPLDELSAGLAFEKPLEVSADTLKLKLGAGGGGRLALIRHPFNEIAVKEGEIYVAAGLVFSAGPGVSLPGGTATFGFAAEGEFTVKCYRRFEKGAQGFPTFSKALAATFSSFLLPRDAADLDDLAADTVLVLAGRGTLNLSSGFSFSMPVQSLASVALVRDFKLDVKTGGSLDVDARVVLTAGYQVRLRRLGTSKVELGVYSLKSREHEFGVSAAAGISAGVGGFDLAERFIGVLSRQPVVDLNEFRKALPDEDDRAKDRRMQGFQASLQAAISTKVQASVRAAFSTLRSDEAAWLFEVDANAAVSTEAKAAITSALRGNFTAVTGNPKALPAGIAQTANVLTRTDVARQSLRINLLGIVNCLSLGEISRVSQVERNASGEITLLTDTTSANRLQALLVNLSGNTKRLRKMLSENFLIEAAYHVADLGVLPPEFKSRHTYLEIHNSTGREQLKNNLDVARVLVLISAAEEERRLGNGKRFGRTTFYAELRYGHEIVRRIFLDKLGNPRSVEDYETLGRSALGALLAGDEGQELRRRYADPASAGSTELWNRMKQTGNTAVFGPLFGFPASSKDPRVGAAGADFIAITSWASAMHAAGAAVSDVQKTLSSGALGAGDAGLTEARERLKKRMADVVKNTHEHFGDPLGMIMVYLASGQEAEKNVLVTGDKIERLHAASAAAQVGGAHA
jgi:hypothetical protein